jgi:uncharacterized protein (DUF2225 family)
MQLRKVCRFYQLVPYFFSVSYCQVCNHPFLLDSDFDVFNRRFQRAQKEEKTIEQVIEEEREALELKDSLALIEGVVVDIVIVLAIAAAAAAAAAAAVVVIVCCCSCSLLFLLLFFSYFSC